jgi:ABC-type dipeptide/oligopeptide/nickel transport system permease subunit
MIMRVVDAMYAFPDILLVVVVSAVVKARLSGGVPWLLSPLTQVNDLLGGTLGIVLALGFTTWPVMCRLVRGQTLSIREFDFILAARSIGAKDFWILRRHVFPNIIGNVIAAITLVVPHAIMIEAGLSFLGLGVDPPTPSWGLIIAEGALAMRAHPHMLVSSTLLLSATVFALIVLGDWLHEMFDPTYLCPETV